MHSFDKKIIINHNIKKLYALVSDINQYPQFIPWCDGLKILKKEKNFIEAEVSINALGIHEKYISTIRLFEVKRGLASILITSNSNPFKEMESMWLLKKIDTNNSEVHFSINFSLKSRILDFFAAEMLPSAINKILGAFEKRANEI